MIDRNKKQLSIISFLFLFAAAVGVAATSVTDRGMLVFGMFAVLLILWSSRLNINHRLTGVPVAGLVIYFLLTGDRILQYYSPVFIVSIFSLILIKSEEMKLQEEFLMREKELLKQKKKLQEESARAEEEVSSLQDDINSFSRLYELSEDLEKVISVQVLAQKSLEAINLKVNASELAFYQNSDKGYNVIEVRSTDRKSAETWLKRLDVIKNRPGRRYFRFFLGSKSEKRGLIIFKGSLTQKQLHEAEVLIYQIALGYERIVLYEEVRELSRTDGLTGLHLRRYFLERLSEEIKRAERDNYSIAFLMMDLDDFKKYNDTYGHPAGDKLLKTVADIIKENIYSTDFPGRYGGEEFCIFMPMAEYEGTMKKVKKIKDSIEEKTPITVSIGISNFPTGGKTVEDIMAAADEALYKAKQEGKNRIVSENFT